MAVNYDKLWVILNEKNMSRNQLREKAGITTNVMARLGRNESVQIDALVKICGVLGCSLEDVVEFDNIADDQFSLPNIDFSSFHTFNQYRIVGLASLTDFPVPITPRTIGMTLQKLYAECKLSREACEELIERLSLQGIFVDFPGTAVPSIDVIPCVFCKQDIDSGDDYDIEHLQVDNYCSWVFGRYNDSKELLDQILTKAAKVANEDSQYLVEYGSIYIKDHNNRFFQGREERKESAHTIYPLNLIRDVLGMTACTFIHTTDSLKSVVDTLLETLSDAEAMMVRLKYQYGLNNHTILKLLDLPEWDTMAWGVRNADAVRRAIRKLQYPSRRKRLRPFAVADPLATDTESFGVYHCWVSFIQSEIAADLKKGSNLEEALSKFYFPDVVEEAIKISNQWKRVPNVSIDEMALDWKSYIALKQAQIFDLDGLWERHGKHQKLIDVKNSGLLSVPGLEVTQVIQILQMMEYCPLVEIDECCIPQMINQIEVIAAHGNTEPDIACGIFPGDVLRYLLMMKYRCIEDVVRDCSNGVIQNEVKKTIKDGSFYIKLHKISRMIESGQFFGKQIIRSDFWMDYLEKNPGKTLQELRTAYMLGVPINCPITDLEEHIHKIFSVDQTDFLLMHETRTCQMRWEPWNSKMINGHAAKRLFPDEDISKVFGVYYAQSTSSYKNRKFLATEVQIGEEKEYRIFEYSQTAYGKLEPVYAAEPVIMSSIYDAILFNSKLSFPDGIQDRLESAGAKLQFINNYTVPPNEVKEPQQQPRCDLIDDLDFTVRTFNVLRKAGITTVSGLLQLSGEELMKVRNINLKCVQEIVQKLKKIGAPPNESLNAVLTQNANDEGVL